jgi:rhamnosyltransferase
MDVDVSIIILTKNAGGRFNDVMDAVHNQEFNGSFEVIVVDSGSTDNTLKTAEEYNAKIFKIKPDEFHHSKTRNYGATKSKGKYLVYLTQDALPINKNWLSNLISPLDDESVGVVYGKQVAYPHSTPMDKFFYMHFYPDSKKILTNEDALNEKKFYLENVFVSNVTSAKKREVWEKIKFNEDNEFAEDKDFALRVLKAGYKVVYEPKAIVYHSHQYSIISGFKRRINDGKAFARIARVGRYSTSIKGFKFITEEVKFLFKNKYYLWIPYALLYHLIQSMGFKLGKLMFNKGWNF